MSIIDLLLAFVVGVAIGVWAFGTLTSLPTRELTEEDRLDWQENQERKRRQK